VGRPINDVAEQLKAESDRLLHVDPHQALRVAEQLGSLAESGRDLGVRALGDLAVGDAQRKLGRYREALAAYARAADVYLALGDEVGWARTRIGASITWRYTGVGADELASIDTAREIFSRRGLWVRLARLEQHVGLLLCELGRLDGSVQAYERAIQAARRLEPRDPSQEARILGNMALVWQRLGEYERAESLLAGALAVFEEHGHAYDLAVGRSISAQLLADQGHFSRALDVAISSRRSFVEVGRRNDAGYAGRTAAYCLLALNRLDEAVEMASAAAGEFEAGGAEINQAATLVLRSSALRRLSRHPEAMRDLARAETIFGASSFDGWVAVVHGERAAVLAARGDLHLAALQAAVAANELTNRGLIVNAAQSNLVRASALNALGDAHQARTAIRAMLESIRNRGVPWLEYQGWRMAADLSLETGRRRLALEAVDAAIQALEQVQGRILTEARAEYLADKLEVYELAVGLCLELGEDSQAFQYADRAKSRALVDTLAGQLDIRIRPRTPDERRLAAELTRLRRRHDQLSGPTTAALASLDSDQADRPDQHREELHACERQIRSLLDELRLANVADLERVALLQGKSYPLDLDAGSLALEYFAAGGDLCVFVQSADGIHGVRLEGALRRVERLSARLHLATQTAAAVRDPHRLRTLEAAVKQVLARLHAELIGPVAGWIKGDQRLVVIPHGMLHRLPFAALHDGARYLIEQREVVVGPSASALAFCRRPIATPRLERLVVANSDGGKLPGAIAEARRIACLLDAGCLLEADATRARLVERARQADVIHLATHGFARLDDPLFSYLKLADGQLTALDCFDLELDCSLVTLSACESGRAQIGPGDEQMGVPRALLYAGARSVLQTLWRVDDDTTARLMERFYAGLMGGAGRGQALRDAQQEMLRSGEGRSHPFFWAPLVLVGDWGALQAHDSA
jgi:CHAT domain-containing protein/tetratricopeptide (TPR) repeat protein